MFISVPIFHGCYQSGHVGSGVKCLLDTLVAFNPDPTPQFGICQKTADSFGQLFRASLRHYRSSPVRKQLRQGEPLPELLSTSTRFKFLISANYNTKILIL
jgi:hypothetical protein